MRSMAQLVEHGACKGNITGLIPAGATLTKMHDCESLWRKASAKWNILLLL